MYQEYWGFIKQPFGNVPNPDFFYESSQHKEAMLRMLYVVENRKGAAILTGKVGCGKTTISRSLINRFSDDNVEIHAISNPVLTPVDFIRAILMKFGVDTGIGTKTILLDRLQEKLTENAEQGMTNVLIIDEAHAITSEGTFEEMRMLLNMHSDNQFLINLLILGQPPLIKKVSALKPLRERIAIMYHLNPLNDMDTYNYIRFRVENAGVVKDIFTKEAVRLIYEGSEGIPLKINNICDRCLLIGLMVKANEIDEEIANNAIEDIN